MSSEDKINIREMELGDIEAVVAVHLRAFSGFFLTFLGASFLKELYTAIVLDPTGMAFVQESHRGISGFVAGNSHPAGFFIRIIKARWWRFGIACVPPIIKSPRIIPRLIRAFQLPSIASTSCLRGTLMSIAVMPDCQGMGVGTLLLNAFLQAARSRGLKLVDLTTDRYNNDSVNSFYIRKGFHISRTFITPEGREMNEYIFDL